MHRGGFWNKNSSSVRPGREVHSSHTDLSRLGSRVSSPRETVSLPSVEFKFKCRPSIPPAPPPTTSFSAGTLSAARLQGDRTVSSGRAFLPTREPRVHYNQEFFSGIVLDSDFGLCEGKPVQPKEAKQQESKERRRRRVKTVRVKPAAVLEPNNQALPSMQRVPELDDGRVARLPLDCQCQHCGILFSRLSIAHHLKWCSRQSKVMDKLQRLRQTGPARGEDKPLGNVVARVVTIGLIPGQYEQVLIRSNKEELPSRPVTTTIAHDTGHGLPLTNGKLCGSSNYEQCNSCGKVVSADKLGIHHRLCQSAAPLMSTGNVKLPSTHNLLKVEQKSQLPTSHKPSAVVCYICGRKYGSHSISIHEPQCLKKFNAQNSELPISQRLPLPKKHNSVARVLLREEEVMVMARVPRRVYMQGEMVEPKENLVQRYLESCYSDFEKELVLCNKCGRTFAPARHRTHEPNCNAKPLKLL